MTHRAACRHWRPIQKAFSRDALTTRFPRIVRLTTLLDYRAQPVLPVKSSPIYHPRIPK